MQADDGGDQGGVGPISLAGRVLFTMTARVQWLARAEASRRAVLKELRTQAEAWDDPDEPESCEDAATLLVAVELLESVRNHYAKPVMPGWVFADDGMGRFYCHNCGRRFKDDPVKGALCPACESGDIRKVK